MAVEKEKKEPEGEKKHEGAKPGGKGGAKKKHLHQIITTFAHDKTASHEHVYKDHKEDHHTHPPVFAGTSADMEDLHQHMDDHAGPSMNGGGGAEPDGDEADAGQPPAGAGAPPAGGAPPEEA
jgi:hypothetical protein